MKTVSTPNIIIGLGNQGGEFDLTRHNVGFEVLDHLNSKKEKWNKGGNYLWCLNLHLNSIMLKPTTGMNLSGLAAKDAVNAVEDAPHIIVIHDDMDFEPGQVRIKVDGGDGRHNGLKSIINKIGSNFIRIRVGIGNPPKEKGIDFVLGKFSGNDRKLIDNSIQAAAEAVSWVIQDGIQKAMNRFNGS